jgi:DNA-binding transcriptional MerR regulator
LTFPLREGFTLSDMEDGLKIGQLARQAGVTAKAIRFYEAKGILPTPNRAANGYRIYGAAAVEILKFIKQATGLNLTLAEIKEIIAIRQGGRPPCTHVHRLLRDKAAELERKLTDLLEVRGRIRRSLSAWKRRPPTGASVCPHIQTPTGRGRRREV